MNVTEANEFIKNILNACQEYREQLDVQNKEIARLLEEIKSLREQINNKQDRKYPSREWHKRNRKVLLK
jgi:peptidoglycan hydrolase CwlO-like protein